MIKGGWARPLFFMIRWNALKKYFVISFQHHLEPLAIYIHWPYCQSICPYCHFNRYLAKPVDWPSWERALHTELSYWARSMPERRVQSVFFGGGTPSLMDPAWVQSILHHIQNTWSVHPHWEVTLEMNPNEAHKASGFVQAGINRFSMGVQSFDPASLALLGRTHNVDHLHKALSYLRTSNAAYSFDLIYGHALHKDPDRWEKDLCQAMPWISDHISLYQLTYEQGTPFYKHKKTQELDDDTVLRLEDITRSHLTPMGMDRYEISNYARHCAHSQHNTMYWTYEDFLGIGPGAHGRVRLAPQSRRFPKVATHNWGKPDVWMKAVNVHHHGAARCTPLTRQQCAEEQTLMGLRLTKGLALTDLIESGETLSPAFLERIATCQKEGLLHHGHKLRLTFRGQCLLNSVATFLCQDNMTVC